MSVNNQIEASGRSPRTPWANLTSDEIRERVAEKEADKKILKKPTSLKCSTIFEAMTAVRKGASAIGSGVVDLARGAFELTTGVVREVDAAALGLGALAIMTICETTVAPVWAMVSKDKNIVSTGREVFNWCQNPNLARAVGYPLLALAGGYAGWQLEKALAK